MDNYSTIEQKMKELEKQLKENGRELERLKKALENPSTNCSNYNKSPEYLQYLNELTP